MAVPARRKARSSAFWRSATPTGIISDTMDELGIPSGVIGASVLRPTIPGKTIVGPALTVRNILQRIDPLKGARDHVNRMAEFEAHNLAQQGDVLVIQGVPNLSNMGGISAQTGKRQGEVGAIVQGGVRDIAHSRAVGYPVWSSDITPVTGKWRLETVEINGPIQIGEVRVSPGDLVVADEPASASSRATWCSRCSRPPRRRPKPRMPGARRSTTAFRCPISRARPTGEVGWAKSPAVRVPWGAPEPSLRRLRKLACVGRNGATNRATTRVAPTSRRGAPTLRAFADPTVPRCPTSSPAGSSSRRR